MEVGEGGSEIGLGKLNLLPILNSSSSCTSGNVACKAFIRACLCMKNQFDIITKVHTVFKYGSKKVRSRFKGILIKFVLFIAL